MARKDFDYVEFADYKRDMSELGVQSAAVIERLVGEKKDLERVIWLLVNAAPDRRIAIYDGDSLGYDPRSCELIVSRNECDMTWEYRAQTALNQPRGLSAGEEADASSRAPNNPEATDGK